VGFFKNLVDPTRSNFRPIKKLKIGHEVTRIEKTLGKSSAAKAIQACSSPPGGYTKTLEMPRH
jgi:hypothetical protein